ncbi:ABC transporter ATP-binding protein [Endozoicomonas sp. 8E]|uniref:ABC transporter ATP-binding protein n=1 Tax=Endozoicomonas sp. 8E TaxID=3035692 RepID=UPI002938CF65|nr:ABC transporter ATP-binding protein [Endozoicomonas sp. 8E]WOG26344.1 ABC transporter ATP-binding protein [Endozoicomonas sp. 8E]
MIELKNVTIDYPLDLEDGASLKSALLNVFRKNQKQSKSYYRALDNVSLRICRGERVGLIGLNGAGKSTMLRVMSGIFQPSHGAVKIVGRVSPLLDFATGLELHHTGIENIRIRLMFLGESPKEIDRKISEIAEFSELGEFIHMPARTYSAGMFMRLAFATSTAINPEMLIADEVVGAGDAQFAEKAKQRIEELLSGERTTVLSSHSMDLIRTFCNRVIWLHNGRIIADGQCEEIIKDYELRAPIIGRETGKKDECVNAYS